MARAIAAWDTSPNIEILGSHDAERLSIVSFVIKFGDRYLHHNFVVAVLNDLFGIQARGGCSCAGPYGHRLLGIDLDRSHAFEREITSGCEGIKPGWVRVNFNYFIDDETFDYLIEAVQLVAAHGGALLPCYTFEPSTGLWRHRDADRLSPLMSLREIDYAGGVMTYPDRRRQMSDHDLSHYAALARAELDGARCRPMASQGVPTTTADFESLRWFPYPDEGLTPSS